MPLVAQTGAVFDDLMAEVTIGETYFFREPGHFALLARNAYFRRFRKHAAPERRFRAWSAAARPAKSRTRSRSRCASSDVAGDVLGTDVSRARLSARRDGRHIARWSFRGVSRPTIERYFQAHDETFVLWPEVRRAMEFRYLNLESDCYPSMSSGVWGMDVIFSATC